MTLPQRRPEESAAVDAQTSDLIAAIESGDGERIAGELDRLGNRLGSAARPAVHSALTGSPLLETMLDVLTTRAKALETSNAWIHLSAAAAAVGRDQVAGEAAATALQRDGTAANAALLLSVVANRRGDHQTALQTIADVSARVPAAKDEPAFIIQLAMAEIGQARPEAALVALDSALTRLAGSGFGFDAHLLRARALGAIPARAAEAVAAWKQGVAAARHPLETDLARDGLIAALWKTGRLHDALRLLDEGLAATRNAAQRSSWLDARASLLAANGETDAALEAFDERIVASADLAHRLGLRLQQAHVALRAGRWKDAGDRFDAARREAPSDDQRDAIRLQKVQVLFTPAIDTVLGDLDALDAAWQGPGWPPLVDIRMAGLLAAGRADEASAWLTQRLARTPGLGNHPAAHQLRGDVEFKRRNIAEGLRFYASAVEAAPSVADARAWAAAIAGAYATQQWKAVLAAHERLRTLDEAAAQAPPVRIIVASAHVRVGQFEQALTMTTGAETDLPPLRALRDVTRGEAQIQLRRFDEMLSATAAALERDRTGMPAELIVMLHALRAQAFNEQEKFAAAREAATAAIDGADQAPSTIEGLAAFVRLGAFVHRSVAQYKLDDFTAAHHDVNAAITGFERLRHSAAVRALVQDPEFARFEPALWFAKGALLDAENRGDEALPAYTRAARLERRGNVAAVARGYALARTGAFQDALTAFDEAHARADSDKERGKALAGKGLALVRLGRLEDAVAALHAALDACLTDPDEDAGVFELLGVAYNGLQRHGAALRAFRRAWTLTPQAKQGANLARGVTAAELRLNNPKGALEFLDGLPDPLTGDRTLLFNRALALDALGRRRAAIDALVRARDAGLERAQQELDRLDAPAGLGRWTHHWFGAQARRGRRLAGGILLAVAATVLTAPLLQWWLNQKFDWYLLLLPSAVALVLLALPNMKSITVEAGKIKLSAEPLPAMARETAAVPTPESFNVPMLGTVVVASRSTLSADVG